MGGPFLCYSANKKMLPFDSKSDQSEFSAICGTRAS